MTGTMPGSKPYRDRLRAELARAGMTGQCPTEQVAADAPVLPFAKQPRSRTAHG